MTGISDTSENTFGIKQQSTKYSKEGFKLVSEYKLSFKYFPIFCFWQEICQLVRCLRTLQAWVGEELPIHMLDENIQIYNKITFYSNVWKIYI